MKIGVILFLIVTLIISCEASAMMRFKAIAKATGRAKFNSPFLPAKILGSYNREDLKLKWKFAHDRQAHYRKELRSVQNALPIRNFLDSSEVYSLVLRKNEYHIHLYLHSFHISKVLIKIAHEKDLLQKKLVYPQYGTK